MYRLWYGRIPKYIKLIIIHIGTNNVKKDSPDEIAKGIYDVCEMIRHLRPNVNVIATGVKPGHERPVQTMIVQTISVDKVAKGLFILLQI